MPRLTEVQVRKRNEAATRFFIEKLRKIPPEILARLTNAVTLAAVTNTYQDSGRFAWNWKVRWNSTTLGGGSGIPSAPGPFGVPPVGYKGEARGYGVKAGEVITAQALKEIGFRQTQWSRAPLVQNIMKDNPTYVTVYNPLYQGRYGEAAAEGKLGTASKVNVPEKIEAAMARESARIGYELRTKGF